VRLPAGLRHDHGDKLQVEVGPLAPGAVLPVPLEVRAVEPGRQVCEVEALADGQPPARSRSAVLVADVGLEMRLLGPETLDVGRESDWRLEVVNASGQPAEGGRLRLRVPEGVEASAASGAATREGTGLAWDVGTLTATQTFVVRLKGRLPG